MYNFGYPRVGNKKFDEVYNEVRKDHGYWIDDIIDTVLSLLKIRLMK